VYGIKIAYHMQITIDSEYVSFQCPTVSLSMQRPTHASQCRGKYVTPNEPEFIYKYYVDSIFDERALLPLGDLSGQGALTEEDVEYMARGMMVMLPKDSQGRSVLCFDSSHCKDCADPRFASHRQRLLFYFFRYLAALNPVSRTEAGLVVITIYYDTVLQDYSRVNAAANLLHSVLPTRPRLALACFLPPIEAVAAFQKALAPLASEALTW
jgi:hypothetical protein